MRRVIEAIGGGVFSGGNGDRLAAIVNSLRRNDYFLDAADFEAYLEAQARVDAACREREGWLRSAVLNTAGVGWFSSDRAIRDYDRKIWRSMKSQQ